MAGGRYAALRMRGCEHAVGGRKGARWARRGPRRATRWRLRRGKGGRRDWVVAGGRGGGGVPDDQPTNGTTSVRRALMMSAHRAKHTCAALPRRGINQVRRCNTSSSRPSFSEHAPTGNIMHTDHATRSCARVSGWAVQWVARGGGRSACSCARWSSPMLVVWQCSVRRGCTTRAPAAAYRNVAQAMALHASRTMRSYGVARGAWPIVVVSQRTQPPPNGTAAYHGATQ